MCLYCKPIVAAFTVNFDTFRLMSFRYGKYPEGKYFFIKFGVANNVDDILNMDSDGRKL